MLTFDKQPRATRKSVVKKGNRLIIRNAKQWQMLVDGVFQGMMPNEPGHGVLVLVQNQEIALYRDKAGMPRVVKLDQKPADIIIDHAFSQSDFSREAIALLEKNRQQLDPSQSQFLFVTEEETAFVLIDLRERLIVFLSYPIDPDTQPSDLPGWFTLRALNSAGLPRSVVSALQKSGAPWSPAGCGTSALPARRRLTGGSTGDSGPPPPLYTGPGMDLAAWEKQSGRIGARPALSAGRWIFLLTGNIFPGADQIGGKRHPQRRCAGLYFRQRRITP